MAKKDRQSTHTKHDGAKAHPAHVRKFSVIHENVMLPPHATHKDPYTWSGQDLRRTVSPSKRSLAPYLILAACSLTLMAAMVAYYLDSQPPKDLTDTSAIRTVKLAKTVDANEAFGVVVKVTKDDRKRPTVALRIVPKLDTPHDIRLTVNATVKGKTADGDEYEQIMENIPCDSRDERVFSRDGIVQVQSVSSARSITLWPNFDSVTTKGTVKKLEHIEVKVIDAIPSESVIDALTPADCSISCTLEDDGKTLHVSGTVKNPCDRPLENAYVLLTTRSKSGGCALPKNREDIPWAYGAQMLMVPIGTIQIDQTAHVEYDIDISGIDVTMANVAAIVGKATPNAS